MQTKRMKALAVAAVATALMGQATRAAGLDLTWDWDGELPLDGSSGFWHGNNDPENYLPNWTPDNGASFQFWDNSGDNAIFGNTGGTVTVDSTVTNAASLKFNSNYTLSGGSFTLSSGVINVASNRTATINSAINAGSGLIVGNGGDGFTGTLILGGPVTASGTTTLQRSLVKLGVTDALPTNQILNMPVVSGIGPAILDLNGHNQTVLQWTGGGNTPSAITNSSTTHSTFTVNTILPNSVALMTGNLSVTMGGTGTWTPGNTHDFTGTLWLKPTGAFTLLASNTRNLGSANTTIKLDANQLPTATQATINWSGPDNTQFHTFTQNVELIHHATDTSTYSRMHVNGAKSVTLTGVISGGTAGGIGLHMGGSGQGNLILAGANTYQGNTIIPGQNQMLTLAHNNALGKSTLVHGTSGLKTTVAFMGGINVPNLIDPDTLATIPVVIDTSSSSSRPDSGYGHIQNLSGDNTFAGNITNGSNTVRFYGADPGSTLTLTGVVGGSKGIQKVGQGTIALTGQNTYPTANATTGNETNVSEGTLRLDFSQATWEDTVGSGTQTNIINNGKSTNSNSNDVTQLVLSGGTLEVKGKTGFVNIQRFKSGSSTTAANVFTVDAGASSVNAMQNGATSLELDLGKLLHARRFVGGTVDFTMIPTDAEDPATFPIIKIPAVTGSVGTNGQILLANGAAFATVARTEWAALDAAGSRKIIPGSEIPDFYTANDGGTNPGTLLGNADMSVDTTTTLTTSPTLTSLRFNNSGARTIDATDQTLTTGGILITSNVGNNVSTITGGTLRGNDSATGNLQDLVIIQNNTGSSNDARKLVIGSVIANAANGSATGLTKAGAGTLELTAQNTYSGATNLTGGVLKLSNALALPGGIDSTGGTANLNIKGGGVIALTADSGPFKRGVGTGADKVQFSGSGGFAAYGGDRIVNLGGASIQATFGSNPNAGTFVPSGGTLIFGAPDADGTVIFENPLFLRIPNQPQQREIHVYDGINAAGVTDAKLAGGLPGANQDGGMTKTGAGILEIAGVAGGYRGPTIVEAGTIRLGVTSGIHGDSVLTVRAGAFELGAFNHTANHTGVFLGGGAAGTTSAITSTSGVFNLSTGVTYNGHIANDNGATISGNLSLGGGGRTFTVNDSSAVDNDLTVSANISGTITNNASQSNLVKAGAGTLLLSGTNTYQIVPATTGTPISFTTINAGRLRVAGGSAIPDGSTVSLANVAGAVFDLNNSSETVGGLSGGGATGGNVTLGSGTLTAGANNSTTTYGGAISGSGALVKTGTGTTTLTGVSSYAGGTSVNGGVLAVAGNSSIGAAGGGIALSNGGSMRFLAATALGSRAISLGSGGGVIDTLGDVTANGAVTGSGSLTKAGDAILNLTNGASNYSGGTTLNAGTIEFAGALGTGNVIFSGGGIKYAAGNTTDLTAGGRVISLNSTNITTNSIDTNGNNVTFANGVGNFGAGHLIKAGAGTLTLNATNEFFGETRSHGGTLVLGASSTSSSVIRAAGGDIVLAASPNGDRLIKTGAALGDGMRVSGGGKIDLTNNKGIIPKSTTNTTTVGNWNHLTGLYNGVYGLVQAGRNGGAWNGSGIITSMPEALNGTTGIGVAPASFAGEPFAGETLEEIGDVKLMYTYVGDADLNGAIDGDDFAIIDAAFSAGGVDAGYVGYVNGDFDYSGKIDADDYWYIDRNYSKQHSTPLYSPSVSLEGVTAVPEPASIGILALATLGAMRRRRHRQRN